MIGFASKFVIFGHVGHVTIVAEAPDQHGGGLGRVEDGINPLNCRHVTQ